MTKGGGQIDKIVGLDAKFEGSHPPPTVKFPTWQLFNGRGCLLEKESHCCSRLLCKLASIGNDVILVSLNGY